MTEFFHPVFSLLELVSTMLYYNQSFQIAFNDFITINNCMNNYPFNAATNCLILLSPSSLVAAFCKSGTLFSIVRTMALPTMTPSHFCSNLATCSREDIPKPIAIGTSLERLTRSRNSSTSVWKSERSPVTPSDDTQYTKPLA